MRAKVTWRTGRWSAAGWVAPVAPEFRQRFGDPAADTVELAADADPIVGKLIKVEADNKATVQTEGTMTLPGGDGATLTLNGPIVGDLGAANAKGYIRLAASGTPAELLACRGRIENAGTTTAVVVTL